MAAPDPEHAGLSAEELEDERFIAALCRNARLQNEEIHKTRKRLRKEIRELNERSDALEARYWQEYQIRLANIADANSKWSTRKWASAFGANEKQLADALAKRQDQLREEVRVKQERLTAVESMFWGAWRKHIDFMSGLTPLPPSSGSKPASKVPGVAPQPTDNQASSSSSASHSNGDKDLHDSDWIMNTAKHSVSGNSSATSQPLPNMPTATVMASNAQGNNPSASQGLTNVAMLSAQSVSPLAGPTPLSYVSSPDPNISATVSNQRRRSRISYPASAQQDNGQKTGFSAPSPLSLTPMSGVTGAESQGESLQEPADNAQSARPRRATAAASRSTRTSAAAHLAKPSPLSLPKLITPETQDNGFVGVTDPVVGEIYQGFYKDENYQGWWMCTVLPWEAWEREIGIRYSFQQADLFKDLPECYTTDRVRAKARGRKMKPVITGWRKGFEAGGPRATERVFPVLFFDDVPGEPGNFKFPDSPEKVFAFNKQALRALPAEWVSAADLRLPGADVGRPVRGRDTAERFRERVRARRALQAKKKLGTPKRRADDGSSSAVQPSSPLEERSSVVDLRSPVEDATAREDTEMADAESLSGATAVDDAAGQPDVWEAAKASPTAKTPVAEKTKPSGSDKGWRSVVLG